MAEANTSDKFAQVRGFQVEIDNAGGKDHDVAWEHVSGGEMIIETVETTIGSDKFHTHSPGHRSVGEITLRGAMTDQRAALCQWINDTVKGRDWRRTLTITEIIQASGDQGPRPGRTAIYFDCMITGYKFPDLRASNQTGNLIEEVTIRPLRVECR
jgi:phage tail-like protein